MLVRQQRLDLRVVQKLAHELGKHLAALQPIAVLGEYARVPYRIVGVKVPRTSGTEDCSPVAPSAGVPIGCHKIPAAAGRSAIARAGSKADLRWRKDATGCGSTHSAHRAQASGSPAMDGSPEPLLPARCRRTTGPDPQIPHASSPPLIRRKKVNQQIPALTRGFSANC